MKTKLIHRFLGGQSSAIAKSLVIILVLLLSAVTTKSYCQEMKYQLGPLSTIQNKTIVRDYNDKDFLSYVETSSQHLFLWLDKDMSIIYTTEIPMDLFVLDFEIFKERVYFCGYRNMGTYNQGMIGYFLINEFCQPDKKDLYVYDNIYFNSTSELSSEFTELEMFITYGSWPFSEDSVHMVAVGKDCNDYCLILDAAGPYNTTGYWRYSLGRNKLDQETFEQISVTDHYVVSSGTIYNDLNNGMGFRVFDKYGTPDIFSTPAIHDNVYRYPTYIGPYIPPYPVLYPISNRFEMTAMGGEKVATLSLYRLNQGGMQPATYYGFLLNIYDIQQTILYPNINCISIATPESYYYGNIHDLRHDKYNNHLVAALTADVPSLGPQSVCAMIPYTQPFPITCKYYYPGLGFEFNKVVLSNISSAPNHTYLTSEYYNGWGHVGYYKYPVNTYPNCTTEGSEICDDPGKLKSKSDVSPLGIYRGKMFNFNTETMYCVEVPINEICRP